MWDKFKDLALPALRSIIAKWIMRAITWVSVTLLASAASAPDSDTSAKFAEWGAAVAVALIGMGIDWLQHKTDKAEIPPAVAGK